MGLDLLLLLARITLSVSIAILVVLAARDSLRDAFGARIAYAFWLIVPAAGFANFLPARRMAASEVVTPAGEPLPAVVSSGQNPVSPDTGAETAATILSVLPPAFGLLLLWFAGFLLSLALLIYRQRRFLKQHDLNRTRGRLCIAGSKDIGPVVVGVFRPRIVLPKDFEQRYDAVERRLILEHEWSHIRAGDVMVNAFAALMQCLQWFNPLVYIALPRLRVDQELACDARVMRKHAAHRRTYAEALLKAQLATRAVPLGCAWPPGAMQPLRQRIAQLGQSRPAPARWVSGVVLCGLSTMGTAAVAWAAIPAEAVPEREAQASIVEDTEAGTLSRALGDALVTALKEGRASHAQALIDAGADVDYYRRGDGTPLTVAAQKGSRPLTESLISAGADVNRAAPGDGNPLIVAAARGNLSLVELLVSSGADVNAYVRGDETPLINAAARNHIEVAQFLIERGADVNLAVDSGNGRFTTEMRSPLGQAQRFGHRRMANLLQRRGAVSTGKER
ncbi:MAG: M56 family metallopeptidase [Pseudomonadota bacterium]